MTIEKMKMHLRNYQVSEIAIGYFSDKIAEYQKKLGNEKLSFAHNDFRNEIKQITEQIRRTKDYQTKILSLLNYCGNDFDRELLQRRYIEQQSLYSIADSLFYSERMIQNFFKKAFERMAAKTKNLPDFRF